MPLAWPKGVVDEFDTIAKIDDGPGAIGADLGGTGNLNLLIELRMYK